MSARRAAGFTLMEVVIALALTGLAVSLIAGAVSSAIRVRERQAETAEAEHRARIAREFVRETVRGLASERAGRADLLVLRPGTSGTGVPSDRLLISTYGGRVFGWDAALKAVELVVDSDPSTHPAGLTARVLRTVPNGVVHDTVVLIPEVQAMRVRLLDPSGTWRQDWPDPTRAPRAVEVSLLVPDDSPARLARLPLRVNVP